MAKIRKAQNEANCQKYNSNLQSWQNKSDKVYYRDQENGIAFFNLKMEKSNPSKLDKLSPNINFKLNNRGEYSRRDDNNLTNKKSTSNKILTHSLVNLIQSYRKGLKTFHIQAKRDFNKQILEYVLDLRENFNFCICCENAVKLETIKSTIPNFDFTVDFVEISYKDGKLIKGKEMCFITYDENDKKERMTAKQTLRISFLENGIKKTKKMYFMEKSKISFPIETEKVFKAIFPECYLILNKDGKLSSGDELAQLRECKTELIAKSEKLVKENEICSCVFD